jgi:transmembrane sensor
MKYQHYNAADFIKDELFQKWVYSPNPELDTFWSDFLSKYPEKLNDVEEARKFLRVLEFREEDIFESRISNLKKRIDESISEPAPVQLMPVPDSRQTRLLTGRTRWYSIAAALLLLIVCSYMISNLGKHPASTFRIADVNKHTTDKGQRTIITLEDGTKVWLNAESKLVYPKSFRNHLQREVFLEGEGFFSVAKDSAKPFLVHTNGILVKVLGTSFNVKSYESDNFIQTTLVEGRVSLASIGGSTNELTLAPNQMAVFDKTTREILLDHKPDTEARVGWTDGKLVFEDQPLSEIIIALERWYNVKFIVKDDRALKCRFYAKIDNLTLQEVLDLFKTSDGIEYEINGDEVIISGLFCEE